MDLIFKIGVCGVLAMFVQGAAAVEPVANDAAVMKGAKFFRVGEADGVWWFIAPDGSRMFSSGVNVVDVGATREHYDDQRPAYAAFRHYPDTPAWARATQTRLKNWGFNTVGGWSAPEMTRGPLPHTAVLHLGKELGAPWIDLLNPQFAIHINELVEKQVAPRAEDPLLIGWYTDNELGWFPDTLLVYHAAQPATSTTRRALVEMLRTHYAGDFTLLNLDFVTPGAADFKELAEGGKLLLRPGGRGVVLADRFTKILAEHFYKVTHDTIRRVDQNHLILGDRYHGFCPDVVAEAAGPYVDVVSTNFDQPDWTDGALPTFYLNRLHYLTKKPLLVTEYYAAAHANRSGNKNTGNIFTTVSNQHERATALRTRLSMLSSLPYVVGAHWFQFSDEPTHGRNDGEDYNFGLVDIHNRPYDELVTAFKETNAQAPLLHAAAGRSSRGLESTLQLAPSAPDNPLAQIASWDQVRATVPSESAAALGDLLVSWDRDHIYLALGFSNYADANAYENALPGASDQLIWRIALAGQTPLEVKLGIGDKISVGNSQVETRILQRGLRYTALVAVPAELVGDSHFEPGDRILLNSTLTDPRRDAETRWKREVECSEIVREASTQQPLGRPRTLDQPSRN